MKQDLPNSKKAFIFGILSISLFWLCGLPGLLFGILGFSMCSSSLKLIKFYPNTYSEKSIKSIKNAKILNIIGIILSIMPLILIANIKNIETYINKSKNDSIVKATIARIDSIDKKTKIKFDSLNKPQQKLKEQINFIDSGFDVSRYRRSVDDLEEEALTFDDISKLIIDVENYHQDNEDAQKLVKILKSKLISLQIKEYPNIRISYVKFIKKSEWLNDVEVLSYGKNNTILEFIGVKFASNMNIDEHINENSKTFNRLRFKKIIYRWYKGSDGTVYSLKGYEDNKLVSDSDY